MTQTRQHIEALTATRAIAAILVVIYHYGGWAYPFSTMGARNILRNGNISVNYFFVLSGFVLVLAYSEKRVRFVPYILKRIARIAPLYLIALAGTLFISAYYDYAPIPANIATQLLYTVFFVQNFFPGYALTLNVPAWSLSVEMTFYALFPLLLPLLRRNFRVFITLSIAAYLASNAIHLYYYPQRGHLPDSIVDTVFFNPLFHLNQFAIGMAGGWIYVNGWLKKVKGPALSLAILLVIILITAYRPTNLNPQVGLYAPLFLLLILAIARSESNILKHKSMTYLGEISYGIYILQFPVFGSIFIMNQRIMHLGATPLFYVSFGILLLVSAALHAWVELPATIWVNKLVTRKSNLQVAQVES